MQPAIDGSPICGDGTADLLVNVADLITAINFLLCRRPATQNQLDRERARVRITHAIRTTMRRLAPHHAALSEHLRATVSTGTYCVYLPDPRRPVEWELGT